MVLAALISGEDRVEVLRPDWHGIQTVRSNADIHPAVDEVIAGSYQHRGPPEIVGSGYVVRSLEDADTTGAVCGQLAGAYWGLSGIPMELLDGLVKRDIIETAARRLINAST